MQLRKSLFLSLLLPVTIWAAEEKTAAVMIADSASAAQLASGKKIFEINCAACHGPTGLGDGPAAVALNPKPRNLKDAPYMSKRPVAVLRQIISEGGQIDGLSPVMVGWKAALKPDQIEDVLQYVLSLSRPKLAAKEKAKAK